MKIALVCIAAIIVLIGSVALIVAMIGAMLPQRHIATRSASFHAPPERLFALIAGPQDWRPDVRSCELLTQDGRSYQREVSRRGETILYEIAQSRPPVAIESRIATPNLAYSGSWTFALEPLGATTRVRVTEDGEVYNPIFRFVSKFVLGQTATQDKYLRAMGKATGEDMRIDD
jgi:Polyketide cyclase / dehydrase and lipid transport